MQPTRANYTAFTHGVQFGVFGIIFLFMTIINRRVDWFILRTVLGIAQSDNKKEETLTDDSDNPPHSLKTTMNTAKQLDNDKQENQKESNNNRQDSPRKSDKGRDISTYLYIELEDDEYDNVSTLRCIVRFLSDILASGILAMFASIIFESLVLSRKTVQTGGKCPTFDAECFGKNGTSEVGPFNCSDGHYTNFSIDSKTVWCVGWVYQEISTNDVLGTLGTCGGLLGIIGSIVPFVYYLSYYRKKCWWISLLCIILPMSTIAGFAFTVWSTLPQGPSQLTIIVFLVLIATVLIGWSYATYRSYPGSMKLTKTFEKWSCCRSLLWKKHKHYPWGCIYDCQSCHRDKSRSLSDIAVSVDQSQR